MARWIAAAVLACVFAQDNKFGNSYLGKAPPELVAPKDQWLNAPEGLKLGKLRGKVVWLEFGFLKCAPCRKMMPVMDKWHQELAGKGLVVIDVDDGSTDDLEEVQKDVKERGTKYAVLWDKERKNCDTYGVEVFPRAYLIGVDGTILWEGLPNSALEEIEKLMTAEFAKVK
ncbi:MAG TPA: TlpA disulfide reductase family protein [Planctomycetota bacterium]|nr:TlpA disulfide reductase family protein [Planctomycetota bacterium]